ncbi:spore germination protein [Paenibacillus sp. P96]|uniref:Spore germination protein n=1 Tax=Paenibacillus zeirhizosphaerae TaxID=2987519 RepID=A0ABT9FTZ1_9BACL|nr:endospore germination permease [Paenibacillus sp. P96]MDP4098209.1 spore germination protein [Paenibacillus sp. P96]
MNKVTTEVSQLAFTLAAFEIGSTTLFLLGSKAKQDAWLAMLIGAVGGFLLLLLHLGIVRMDSGHDLFELCKKYMGKWLGSVIGIAFVFYFTYESSRNLRDIGDLATLTLLNRTPTAIVTLLALLVIADSIHLGPRAWFLIVSVLFYLIAIGYVMLLLIISFTGLIHPQFMFPILENGWKPVWEAAIPEIISFPFGQTVLFLVFFRLVSRNQKINKSIMFTYWLTAILLIGVNQICILVLGPDLAASTTYPLFQVTQLTKVDKIIERADPLFAMILFLGLGIKSAAFYIGAVIGMSRITVVKYKVWIVVVGTVIYSLTFLSPVFTEFLWIGLHIALDRVWPIFQIALPLLLFFTMSIRKNKRA